MHIRPATAADITSLAHAGTTAFSTDPLFSHLFSPRSHHPEAYASWWTNTLTDFLHDPARVVLAAVPDPEDHPATPGEPIGFAVWWYWTLDPASAPAPRGLNTFRPPRAPPSPENSKENPAVSAAAMAVFGAAIEREIEEHFSERDMLHWHLHLLAVAPEWQRRGAGRLLVEWGFEQADLDGVVAAVEASVAGVGFYCKVGFGVVGETRVEFEEGVVVLPVMVRPVGGCRVGGG